MLATATPRHESETSTRPGRSFVGWVGRTLPTLFTLLALGGVAYWGHQNDWTIPTFAALTGNVPEDKDEWCEAHSVPEAECIVCKPELLPVKLYGWCATHGIPECPFEHPDVAQLKKRPHITQADRDRAQRALEFLPRSENNKNCKLHLRRIQFASEEAVKKAGVDDRPVRIESVTEAVSANGEVTYDQTRVARLSVRVPGTVWQVPRQVGDAVQRGDVLALVDAAEVGKAKAEFLQAVVHAELKTSTVAGLRAAAGSVPERTIREAEAALREANIRLLTAEQALVNLGLPIRAEAVKGLSSEELRRRVQFLGLPEAITRTLDPRTTTANLIPVVSPLDGIVITREVVAGEVVDAAKGLFVVADVRQMWLTLNLRLEDTKKVALGQQVRFRLDGGTDPILGTVGWISTSVDEKTRTVKVRADLANPDGRLRANTFGQGEIILREEPHAVIVPNQAVHWEGDCFVVFVRDKNYLVENAPKVFHVRKVRVGVKDARNTEIIAGVLPGEVVATTGSGTLLAVLKKDNMGAG